MLFRSSMIFAACLVAVVAAADQRDERPPHERARDNWRRDVMPSVRVASSEHLITDPQEIEAYRSAGFNALVVFDVEGANPNGTAWGFKTEDRIREETSFAREQNMPLIIGLAVEPFTTQLSNESSIAPRRPFAAFTADVHAGAVIPGATDDEIRARVALWKHYGDDIVIGAFPWYDDVFLDRVSVERQRHVYRVIKSVARGWYVFGMIGEFGFNAAEDDVAAMFDSSAFDHLIVLMYPYNLSSVTGIELDNVASADPDGDIAHYVDRYIDGMNEKYFARLRTGQLLLVVVQAFYYTTDSPGRIPRPADIDIMSRNGGDRIRGIRGQEGNNTAAYFYWGGNQSLIGIAQRTDWFAAIANVNADLERRDRIEKLP